LPSPERPWEYSAVFANIFRRLASEFRRGGEATIEGFEFVIVFVTLGTRRCLRGFRQDDGCGKPSTVLVLDPGKPYVYLCASCEADNPAQLQTTRISDIDNGSPA